MARKEIRRYLVVWIQTLLGPVVFALILLTVFLLVNRAGRYGGTGVTYAEFLAPGLIVMSMMQNAFANTSSSILIAKQSGTIADILMAPMRSAELTTGFAAGGLARGATVGLLVGLVVLPFGGAPRTGLTALASLLAFGVGAALAFSLLGIIGGICARKMEHIAFMSQIVVAPLTLLSGTFYSMQTLPGIMVDFIRFNPIFYVIDGFRSSYIDYAESDLTLGLTVLFAAVIVLFLVCNRMFATGYRLKA